MKLVYQGTDQQVKAGDKVLINDVTHIVVSFAKPHKPASSGKAIVKYPTGGFTSEYYVGVIGAEWIEREDRTPE